MSELSRSFVVTKKEGLHMRPADAFVRAASRFDCHVDVASGGRVVNGKSVMGVLLLGACCGTEIVVHTRGDDAEACMDALAAVIEAEFGKQ